MSNPPMEDDADPTYSHFAHRAEFEVQLARFLAIDVAGTPSTSEDDAEVRLVNSLGAILDYYLPMPGLLDPALDAIVPPLMEALASGLGSTAKANPARLARVGRLVNWVVKVRGWKAVVPHFPSAIEHLGVLIDVLSTPAAPADADAAADTADWELRAVLLLWLALLLTVPFSLSALSDSSTPTRLDIPTHARLFSHPTPDLAVRVTLLALPLLHRPGREGGYAALVLARLFAREDAVQGLQGFFDWASAELREGEREAEANLVASLLTLLALLPGMADERHLPAQAAFLNDVLVPHLAGGRTSQSSGLIRKLAVKARGRWWLARLGRGLRHDAEAELPDGIEEQLDDLMSGLGDRDTIVRYSSAKYLGCISALLPPELSDQIVLATIGLFAGTDDEPVVETAFGTVVDPGGSTASGGAMGLGGSEATRGEARWHGVCLAVAELARRGLLDADAVAEVTPWVVKALTFDLRRASHSIGSNVRDAASYVLWSLSRASPPEQLADAADRIATSLVCVAVFDREVGVRRAASAAFQEGVGRLGLYPAGIDVLAKTDFYSVSVRRKAFTVAAPAVAEHAVYRAAMREFLHNITLRHWDIAMRTAGAAALKAILALSSPDEVSDSITRELAQVPSLDSCSAHGALAALTQIASLTGDATKGKLLASLDAVRAAALVSTDAADIITAGCELIAATLTPTVDLAPVPRFFEAATRRREAPVHEALADACQRLSEVRDATPQVLKSIEELKSARAAQRQAAALCLGHFQYKSHAAAEAPLAALLGLLTPEAKSDVETKRNAVRSLADLSCQRDPDGTLLLRPEGTTRVVQALVSALEDYTTDQRGDVGSWVRTAAVLALGRVIGGAATAATPADLVSQEQFDAAISGIVKQALEKLQVVRDASTTTWAVLLEAKADKVWDWPAANVFATAPAPTDPRHTDQWFSAGLEVFRTRYRPAAVSGILQSAGGSVSSTERSCAELLKWLRGLGPADSALLDGVLGDIVSLLANNFSSNRIAVPALTTIGRLFDAGIATWPASQSHEVVPVPALYSRALALAARGASQIKSIDRLTAAMRVVVASLVLPFDGVRAKAADALLPFLAHRFPRIRMLTSEALYTTLTTDGDIDEELEEVILETEWTAPDGVDEAPRVVQLVREHLGRTEDLDMA